MDEATVYCRVTAAMTNHPAEPMASDDDHDGNRGGHNWVAVAVASGTGAAGSAAAVVAKTVAVATTAAKTGRGRKDGGRGGGKHGGRRRIRQIP